MKLYEHEGKRLFAQAGIRIPRGKVVASVEEAAGLVEEYGGVMVKAQILWGKRSREGGIVACESQAELDEAVGKLLGSVMHGEKVAKVLVEEKLPVASEAYVSITYQGRRPVAILSVRGGVDVEQIREEAPEGVVVEPVNVLTGIGFGAAEEIARRAGFSAEGGDDETEHLAGILLKLYQMFYLDVAILAEINPLIRTSNDDWYAADAKVEIDEDALYRQAHLGLPERLPSGRPPTKLEAEAREADRIDTRGAAGRMFFELPGGTIVVLASGGGTSVEALDALCLLGGKVAVFTEYSGNPSAEKVAALTKVALQYPGPIDAIWAVGGRANFTDIYETLVNGVMAAVRATEGFDKTIPIVVRRAGPRDAEAFDALRRLREWEGYNIFLRGTATSVTDSARIVMHQADIQAGLRKGGDK